MQDNRESMWVNRCIYRVGPPPHQITISRNISKGLKSVHSLDQYRFAILLQTVHMELSRVEEQMLALRRSPRQQKLRNEVRHQALIPNGNCAPQFVSSQAVPDHINLAEKQRETQGKIDYLKDLLVEVETQSRKVDEQYRSLAVELCIARSHTRPLDERGAARMDARLHEIRKAIRRKVAEQEEPTEDLNNIVDFISSIRTRLLPSTPDTFIEVRSKKEADAFLYNIGPIEKFRANRLKQAAQRQQNEPKT
ncbi:hypothetical protein, conserved [Eimeria brunetti]|uniref:Uncharacterized protein n=1 Tax=Eimeria brunetti TaxID=51314 RepID=U6LFY3_9EIME|nr:hypothetical protein, conserved [Eimeria brunetti]